MSTKSLPVAEVEIGRRISIPHDYSNVYVAARIPVEDGESVADAMARASELVDRRLPIEVAKAIDHPRPVSPGQTRLD